MDHSALVLASLFATVFLSVNYLAESATLFSQLSNSLTVSVSGAQNVSSPDGIRAGTDELYVTWSSSTGVDDSSYKTVELKLCFGAPSQVDRAWRKTNDILSKDKTCLFDIASPRQPYTAAGNTTVWLVGKQIPFAHYFVRAYVLDSSGEKIAYGQSSNAQRTGNLFTIEPISGRHASIDIAAGVFSAFSVVSLLGFFFLEKANARRSKT